MTTEQDNLYLEKTRAISAQIKQYLQEVKDIDSQIKIPHSWLIAEIFDDVFAQSDDSKDFSRRLSCIISEALSCNDNFCNDEYTKACMQNIGQLSKEVLINELINRGLTLEDLVGVNK